MRKKSFKVETRKLTIDIPKKIYYKLIAKKLVEGKTIGAIIRQLVYQYLGENMENYEEV